jgi:DNA invertase Pin-like site-specific DNA recombinase
MNEKITEAHRQRAAYIYVRQSTQHQVRHHHQGRERQYELAERAEQLGFAKTVLIDEDQGRTGSGAVERPGFGNLLAAVCGGEVGAVFALEASRLARNNRDWHHLVDLCAMTETLIIDAQGIYDPRQLDDRLLLGLKGTMSEFELGLFRQRAREAFERKIRSGHVLWEVPVGYVRNEDDKLEKIADRQVQSAIDGVFAKFRQLGSARQTTIWYRDEQIALPEVVRGTRGHQVLWRVPGGGRLYQILKNPCYAGALVYGRTEGQTRVENGRARKSSTRRRKPSGTWKVLIKDDHEGYITWNEHLEILKTLESNVSMRNGTGKGAIKTGPALLGGLLRCGNCGRKMFVAYSGIGGCVPRYACNGGRTDRGSAPCQSLGGARVDQAVADTLLQAIEPAGIRAAFEAAEHAEAEQQEKRSAISLALEKAQYEVRRAQRQYDQVDPDNRLVAGELEGRWNAALARVADLEADLAALDRKQVTLSTAEQRRLLELGNDLPRLWNHTDAEDSLKKRILRSVLEEIMIRDNEDRTKHVLHLHWKGGAHTELVVRRNKSGKRPTDTSTTALELIEELSKVCNAQSIAATLNRLGFKTGAGKTWRLHSVYQARSYHGLTNHGNQGNWLTVKQAADELGVSQTVIRRLIQEQKLAATQVVEQTPWIIARKSLSDPVVQHEVNAVRAGRQLRKQNPKQGQFPFK